MAGGAEGGSGGEDARREAHGRAGPPPPRGAGVWSGRSPSANPAFCFRIGGGAATAAGLSSAAGTAGSAGGVTRALSAPKATLPLRPPTPSPLRPAALLGLVRALRRLPM